MQISIVTKLTLSILGLTAVVLVATLGLARWSFDRGLLDYVNTLEQMRLGRMGAELVSYYERHGSFTGLSDAEFLAIQRRHAPSELRGPRGPHPGERPPPPERGADRREPGPSFDRRRGPGNIGPSTALYSPAGDRLAGQQPSDANGARIRHTLYYLGEAIGELRATPRRELNAPQDTAFSRQQLVATAVIGAVALLAALIFSWILSTRLLRPVSAIAAYVRELTGGTFEAPWDQSRQDELGKLMDDLSKLGLTLSRNQTARNRWIADISHELRTPVTILTGELEALREGIRPFDGEHLDSLSEEVERLSNLVGDLYDLSLSDLGGLQYQFDNVEMSTFIIDFMAPYQVRNGDLEISIHTVSDAWIQGDARRLDQLFTNLMQNTVKYTDRPGTLAVTCSVEQNRLQIDFEDSGPGVELVDQVFEPFYRERHAHASSGAGLGLAICQNIVDAHGGTIIAEDSELGGLRVRMVFTLDRRVA